jgi:PTS system mannose-specific IIB component/fructoselysine and glucoselysine-specific PTS system IIB component
MPLVLFRIDERLLHGQVIVGWGMRLRLDYYVVVDDDLADSEWEQDLYSAGLPQGTPALFLTTAETTKRFEEIDRLRGRGALLTRGTREMRALAEAGLLRDQRVNVGGLHAAEGRRRAASYVYLREDEMDDLRAIEECTRGMSARDLPGSREVDMKEFLDAAK